MFTLPIGKINVSNSCLVGGKSLGVKKLYDIGVPIPKSIAVTIDFYTSVLDFNKIFPESKLLKNRVYRETLQKKIRNSKLSTVHKKTIKAVFEKFDGEPIAIRSSCVYEDMDNASFSGQYESYINVTTLEQFEKAVLNCYASVYSERVIDYFEVNNISSEKMAMALLIQESIEPIVSGVVFTAQPQSGSENLLYIEANYGYGETVVSNKVEVDSFLVYKPTLQLVQRHLGRKAFYYAKNSKGGYRKIVAKRGSNFCLNNDLVKRISELSIKISLFIGKNQDIEFALDHQNKFIILQTRNLVLSAKDYFVNYSVETNKTPIISGKAVVAGAGHGIVRAGSNKINSILLLDTLEVSDIPHFRKATAVIVKNLSAASHAASVLRELKIPTMIYQYGNLESLLSKKCTVIITNESACIYEGYLSVKENRTAFTQLPSIKTKVFVGCSDPSTLYQLLKTPIEGIGLIRSEFIINNEIGIHPLALVDYDKGLLDKTTRNLISRRIMPFSYGKDLFTEKLANGLASILSLVPDKIANFRLSDFQSDSYVGLIGGEYYEPKEQNPMMGFRGCTRLLSAGYKTALQTELGALQKVWNMGFHNFQILLPFCRLPEDATELKIHVRQAGLTDIKIGMMVELASNIFLAKQFSKIVDFFFIGPRDLTQNIYAADRGLPQLAKYAIGTEAVKEAVLTFFKNIDGQGKEVFIALFDLFKHIEEYRLVKSNNVIYYSGSPSEIINDFFKLEVLENHVATTER